MTMVRNYVHKRRLEIYYLKYKPQKLKVTSDNIDINHNNLIVRFF